MNLSVKLNKNFIKQYNALQTKYGKEMAKLNGFAPEQLSFTDFIKNFQQEDVLADSSVDSSSNVSRKDVVSLLNEMSKPHMKLLSFHKIFYEMQKKYGYKTACEWLEKEWNGKLYMHDAPTASYKSYCFAYDLKDLAEKGLYFISDFNAEPPKHLTTFVDFVKEFVSYFCVRTSGAVGLPNLIPYLYYFWREDVKNGYYTKNPDIYARQNVQRLIYSLNQPFLREQIQSAFTNTSVFDREYLTALFGASEFPDGSDMIDDIEEIMKFQKLFMEVMSDIRSHNMCTYPVSTISLIYKDGKFADEEFADWAIRHNMKWCDSNFFIDETVSSLSNCPLSPDTQIFAFDGETNEFVSDTIENLYKKDKQIVTLSDGKPLRCKINKFNLIPNYKITLMNGLEVITTKNHLNKVYGKNYIETKDLTIEDYLPISKAVIKEDLNNSSDRKKLRDFCMVDDSYMWFKIKSIERISTNYNYSFCLEVLEKDKEPIFTLANGIVTHNCRLRSDISELYMNSIGGTALKVGSVKVSTINLARIAYESETEEEYLLNLRNTMELNMKVLDVQRSIIRRNVEKGLMPHFDCDTLDFEHLFSTCGIIGVYETIKKFGYVTKDEFGNTYYTKEADDFGKKIFDVIHKCKDLFIIGKDYKINIEQIPGESAADKLMKKDKILFPDKVVKDLPLYGNQFIPLGIKTTMEERIRIAALFDSYCNGG